MQATFKAVPVFGLAVLAASFLPSPASAQTTTSAVGEIQAFDAGGVNITQHSDGTATAPAQVIVSESGVYPAGNPLTSGSLYTGTVAITAGIGNVSYLVSAGDGYTSLGDTSNTVTAYGSASWSDAITLTSATLPIGTPVQMQLSNTFAGFYAQHIERVAPTQANKLLGEVDGQLSFRVQPDVFTDNGQLSLINPTVQTTVTDNFSDLIYQYSDTGETTTTYLTPPTFTERVGDTIFVQDLLTGSAQVSVEGLAYAMPTVSPASAYTTYPYSFIALSGPATTHVLNPNATPDVSLIDAYGHDWLAPVSGAPITPIDPFSVSYSFDGAPVPESSSATLLGFGSLGLLLIGLKKRLQRRPSQE